MTHNRQEQEEERFGSHHDAFCKSNKQTVAKCSSLEIVWVKAWSINWVISVPFQSLNYQWGVSQLCFHDEVIQIVLYAGPHV